jgi:hypothetical protein
MSSAISASNFIEAMKGWSPEELDQVRSAIQALAPKKEKVAKAPVAPVLDPAYVVAEPATKGVHKGKPRWQNTDTENYVYEFPALAPAAKKVKAPAPAPAPAAKAPSAGSMSDEQLMGRMSKEDVAALSKEDKKRRNELKKAATEERKKNRSPEDQAKIDAKVAKMQAARAAKKNAAGGSAEAEAEEEESGSGLAADE